MQRGGEPQTLGHARKTVLMEVLRYHVHLMKTDLPRSRPIPSLEIPAKQFDKKIEIVTGVDYPTTVPIWALAHLAALIAVHRSHIDSFFVFTSARLRIFGCHQDRDWETHKWLWDRWGEQVWPDGQPATMAEALKMVGTTQARVEKTSIRAQKDISVTELLSMEGGIARTTERLKRDCDFPNDSLQFLDKLMARLLDENERVFYLDGRGWDAIIGWVGPGLELLPCNVKDLEASSERQLKRPSMKRSARTFMQY